MAHSHASGGFTLIEVALAIVIGVVVLAGGIATYNQARESAATGRMKEKIMTAVQVVEEISAQMGAYPNPTDANDQTRVITKYKTLRPDDFDKSPWGGNVGAEAMPNGINPYWMQPYNTLPVIGGETQLAADGAQNLSGSIQYFALGTGTTMMPTATGSYYDKTRRAFVTYRGWVVSGVNSQNYDGWGVYGPKP